MKQSLVKRLALIGFGEVGGIFGYDFANTGFSVSVYDILLDTEPARAAMLDKAQRLGVRACDTLGAAIDGADLVISAVTSSSALGVAAQAVSLLRSGQIYLDINSVSPETKREIGGALIKSQAAFVEAAVMAPVAPRRIKAPMLLGGPHAAAVAAQLREIGMDVTPVSDQVGVASAIKMCRSIIIKGLEAITVESMFTARRYGAEKLVLESLAATYPEMGWDTTLPDYLISRVAEHGKRRAAEMREAAQAVTDAGLEPLTALATSQRQDWLARSIVEFGIALPKGENFKWEMLADALVETSPSAKNPSTSKG